MEQVEIQLWPPLWALSREGSFFRGGSDGGIRFERGWGTCLVFLVGSPYALVNDRPSRVAWSAAVCGRGRGAPYLAAAEETPACGAAMRPTKPTWKLSPEDHSPDETRSQGSMSSGEGN